MDIKIDATCPACGNKIKTEEINKLVEFPASKGGFILEHKCPDNKLGGSCTVWKGTDGVWRREKPGRTK